MARRQSDGATLADHLRAAQTARGKRIDELHVEPLPVAAQGVFDLFTDLQNWRGSGGFGPSLLTTADVESFLRMTGQRVTHWELEMLKVLDVTAMRVAQEGKSENG